MTSSSSFESCDIFKLTDKLFSISLINVIYLNVLSSQIFCLYLLEDNEYTILTRLGGDFLRAKLYLEC